MGTITTDVVEVVAVLGIAGVVLVGTRSRAIRAVLVGWLGAVFFLGAAGAFEGQPETRVPTIAFAVALPIVVGAVLLARSESFRRLVDAVPLPTLVGVQLYRVIGAMFLVAFAQDRLPAEFALPAGIGDVAVGLTAPLVAYRLVRRRRWSRRAALTWNVFGIADLVVAVATGFLTSPSAYQQLAFDEPNQLIVQFPFVLVPAFAVPVSILLHIFALRRLTVAAQAPSTTPQLLGARAAS